MKTARNLSNGLLYGVFVLSSTCAPIGHAAAQSCIAPPSDLVSWWTGDGAPTDSIGSNDGVISGDTVFTSGQVDQAFDFDGSGDFVTIPAHPSLEFGGDFTVDLWVNLDTPGPCSYKNYVYHQDFTNKRGWILLDNCPSNSFIVFRTLGSGAFFDARFDRTLLTPGVWRHIAGVHRAGTNEIYLDGALLDTTGGASFEPNVGAPMFIGSGIDGRLDEIEIFDRALSEYEIQAIFEAGPTGQCKFPVSDSDADLVPDFSDNCPFDSNPDQGDFDFDGIGDVCDADSATVDPKATYLHTVSDEPALPTIIDLAADGFTPGTVLGLDYEIPPPGFSFFSCDGPFVASVGLSGVFSGSAALLPESSFARVPDAIDAGADVATGPTHFGNEANDIPEDFQVDPQGGFTIEIPAGATHLFLGILDSLYRDNCGTINVTISVISADSDGDGVPDDVDNCPAIGNPGQEDFDGDGSGDACDADDDNDTVADELDDDPLDALVCRDTDGDSCDDCSSGLDDPASDGIDTDGDGLCDAGDEDDDGDGVPDVQDDAPLNPTVCRDADGDGCDDCNSGTDDPANDGIDFDGDGLCDVGDEDDDGDGVPDVQDGDSLNPFVCRDADLDGCDDCSSGVDDPASDGVDFDGDGLCDAGDPDDDNDGLDDVDEIAFGTDPFNADTDGDGVFDGTEVDIAEGSGCPDPLVVDSDGDTISDGDEVAGRTSPCNTDTDGDAVPDNVDPEPLDPGIEDFIAVLLRTLCDDVAELDLALFDAKNNNARKGRRNALCNKLSAAANASTSGDVQSAIDQLTTILAKLDGSPQPKDWMVDSPARTALRDELEALVMLLEFLL